MRLSFLFFLMCAAVFAGCTSDPAGAAGAEQLACPHAGERRCDGVCIPVDHDPTHCGDCARQCDNSQVCEHGVCVTGCATGGALCAGGCVEISSNRRHCGACGAACRPDQVCIAGACVCSSGRYACGDACVNLQNDADHCGDCQTTCPDGRLCEHGVCGNTACAAGLSACAGGCVDLMSDADHCGECGNACGGGQLCSQGRCHCPQHLQFCGSDGCVDTATNPADCGGCGVVCAAGQVCRDGMCAGDCGAGRTRCGGRCVDVGSDANHCGGCGRRCTDGQRCASGQCACPGGAALCAGVCTDLNHPRHCGGCTTVCDPGNKCSAGTCQPDCAAGLTACGRICSNLQTDVAHCGRCSIACTGGHVCQGGACVCPAGWLECDGHCVDPQRSPAHCGACGQRCTGGICQAGRCTGGALSCPPGQLACEGVCIDPQTDAAHCGTCTIQCEAGLRCSAGRCRAGGGGGCTAQAAMWEPIELRFEGPNANENDSNPNPFTDYRLTVTFTGPSGQRYDVPGFFDGDGNGGGRGRVWKARFSADEAGTWSWSASFRSGSGIALDPAQPGAAAAFDGQTGQRCVGPVRAQATGFLARGRLEYAGGHYFRMSDGTYWLKGGADSPENFLGYAGFDDVMDQPGGTNTAGLQNGLHRYQPHIADWQNGDPDWNGGAGRGIIGALNYLASQEVNSIYFLPCNLGGDGRDTHPYVAPDDLRHIDISRMAQWEMVFAHATRKGIALHFVLSETETGNENLHDNGTLGPERRLFYRELIARFGHHPAIVWNIGEENDYGATKQKLFAGYIRDLDPYDHPITVHTHVNNPAGQYNNLVGDARFELTSIQLSPNRAGEFTETWRQRSAAAGRPWVVMLDEIGPAGTGVTDTNAADIRKQTLWPALMSGAGGVEWYFGYHALPLGGDVRVEDFRTREPMWRFTRIARRFFEDNLPFTEMEPADSRLSGAAGEVFQKAGAIYAVYLPDASPSGRLNLSGQSGTFQKRWFDPRTGRFAGSTTAVTAGATVPLGNPPSAANDDWVVLLTR